MENLESIDRYIKHHSPSSDKQNLENTRFQEKFIFLNLFLLALLVRIIYAIFLKKHPFLAIPILDAEYYVNWAQQILKEGWLGDKVFFTEPFYAYLLAIALKISNSGQYFVLGLQILLGSLLPLLVFNLAKRLFNRSVAVLAGLISAIYGPFIFYDYLLLKTSLETFFLTLFVLILVVVMSSRKKWPYFAAGIYLGLLASLKGNATILVPVIVLFIIFLLRDELRKKIILIGLFVIGFIIAISPIAIRNYIVGHDFVPTNYSIGLVLYGGNWWDSDGSLNPLPFMRPVPKYEGIDTVKMAEAYAGKPLKPSQVSQFWINKAISEIVTEPGRWLKLTGRKILLLMTRVELSDNYDYAFYAKLIPVLRFLPSYWPVAVLAFTAIILLLFSQDARTITGSTGKGKLLIVMVVASYSLLQISSNVNSRYRIPLVPFLIIFASFCLWYLVIKLKSVQYGKLFTTGVVIAVFIFLTSIHLDNFDYMTDANYYNNLGAYYQGINDDGQAQKYFDKAIAVDKNYPWAHGNLFNLYLRHAEFNLAQENLREQIRMRPDDLGGYYYLKLYQDLKGKPVEYIQNRLKIEEEGSSRKEKYRYDPYFFEFMHALRNNNTRLAESYLEKSAKKLDNPPNTMLNLAVLKKSLGDTETAKEILIKLARQHPKFIVAKYNLANIYIKEKNYLEVAKLLQDVYDIVPEFGDGQAWFYLAAAYINSKNYDAALPIVQGFIEKYKNDPKMKKQVETFKSRLTPATGEKN